MRRYLIVDDNQAFAENLAEILADSGAEVDVANSGAAALERVAGVRYDALLSDMKMPVMGGPELVRRIRRLDPGLPVLVITAYTNDDDLFATRQEGLLAVLPKPTPVTRLIQLCGAARRDGVVVLIEDDPALSDDLTEALRGWGFAVVTAASVLETERLGAVRPFAALVDKRVAGGPDEDTMTRLALKYPDLPTLTINAHMDTSPGQGHEAHRENPFRTSDLRNTVERLYESRRGST